jgi:hypothetical protein
MSALLKQVFGLPTRQHGFAFVLSFWLDLDIQGGFVLKRSGEGHQWGKPQRLLRLSLMASSSLRGLSFFPLRKALSSATTF